MIYGQYNARFKKFLISKVKLLTYKHWQNMFYFSKKIEILVYTYTVAWSMGPAEKQNIQFTNSATNKFVFTQKLLF